VGVCVVVGALQALFAPLSSGTLSAAELIFQEAATIDTPAQRTTKASIRQQLAIVCAVYPGARPTRGNLKQVFNCLHDANPSLDETL
jgi:hypothetical protein